MSISKQENREIKLQHPYITILILPSRIIHDLLIASLPTPSPPINIIESHPEFSILTVKITPFSLGILCRENKPVQFEAGKDGGCDGLLKRKASDRRRRKTSRLFLDCVN